MKKIALLSILLMVFAVSCGKKKKKHRKHHKKDKVAFVEKKKDKGDWKKIDADCSTNAKSIETKTGKKFKVKCPAGCKDRTVYGTDVYTTDSSLCAAGIHAGAIGKDGGKFKIKIKEGEKKYDGTKRNGVESRSWGSYNYSFKVLTKD
ncbi:hypothetical protein KKF34_18390 [Myxococcota bacterium]|nr:hypothetical protein [Myxococcota bacterium]MBU1381582.1 hypothetical protein [Myxococcota bacterium]MBU1498854.1 hypothetical protein [Myxococcota bacterium]